VGDASQAPPPALGLAVEPAPLLRACLFRLANAAYAVDVRQAREVAVFDEVTRVPRAPDDLLGVANLRGTVMPLVDIRPLLGLGGERLGRGALRTLVIHDGAVQVAVAVEQVVGLEPFDEVAPCDGGEDGLVAGRLRWQGEPVTLLDAPRLIRALRARLLPAPGEAETETQSGAARGA
jgi:purine-binding chemotaxis protein CheW